MHQKQHRPLSRNLYMPDQTRSIDETTRLTIRPIAPIGIEIEA